VADAEPHPATSGDTTRAAVPTEEQLLAGSDSSYRN
jgi:hypothetical protein